MVERPVLSIIIPTRDNEHVAFQTINAVAGLKLKNVEIIVQDNGKRDTLKEKLADLTSNNSIIYKYSNAAMPIIGNFNLSLKEASGDYICFIGDDDGIHPAILEVAKWAKANKIESVVPRLKAIYYWPESYKQNCRGRLLIEKFDGKITKYKSNEQIIMLLKNGCLDYINYCLPKAYHGIVSREKMEKIKNITGDYFGGLVPDIYSVTALSLIINEVTYIDFPLTISGISPKSNSGKAVKSLTNGKLEEAPQLRARGEYTWSSNIPKIFSDETIWADSLMHALDDMNRADLKVHFDSKKLNERVWTRYKGLREIIEESSDFDQSSKSNSTIKFINWIKLSILKIPVLEKLVLKLRGKFYVYDLPDINSAVEYILKNLDNSLKLND